MLFPFSLSTCPLVKTLLSSCSLLFVEKNATSLLICDLLFFPCCFPLALYAFIKSYPSSNSCYAVVILTLILHTISCKY